MYYEEIKYRGITLSNNTCSLSIHMLIRMVNKDEYLDIVEKASNELNDDEK